MPIEPTALARTSLTSADNSLVPIPDEVEHGVNEKDKLVATFQVNEAQHFLRYEDDATRLLHAVRAEGVARGHLEESLSGKLSQIHERMEQGILQERQERHTAETEVERAGEEKVAETKGALAEDKMLQEQSNAYSQEICDEICHLYSDIEQERKFRTEKCERLGEGVRFKLGEIREAVAAERQIRLESEHTLLELFGQMGQKIEQDMAAARRERELSHNRVLDTLEAVLPQLDKATSVMRDMKSTRLKDNTDAKSMAQVATENFRRLSVAQSTSLQTGRLSLLGSRGVPGA